MNIELITIGLKLLIEVVIYVLMVWFLVSGIRTNIAQRKAAKALEQFVKEYDKE